VLYQTTGWISHPRVSPKGDLVAFIDHPIRRDDGGSVMVVDRDGKRRTLAGVFSSLQGLAWAPTEEVWFTGTRSGGNRAIHAVSLTGRERLLARVTESLTIQDIASDGRTLVSHDVIRIGVLGKAAGETTERDLSWLDWSAAFDLSHDGRTLLFNERAGIGPGLLLLHPRGRTAPPPVRSATPAARRRSRRRHWVNGIRSTSRRGSAAALVYPTGAGRRSSADGTS
jgi:hypothetical protein